MKTSICSCSLLLFMMLWSSTVFAEAPKLKLFCEGVPTEVHAYGTARKNGSTRTTAIMCFQGAALESDDVVHATLYKGSKKVQKVTCKGRITVNDKFVQDLKIKNKDLPVYRARCSFEKGVRTVGTYSVKVDYQSLEDEKTHKNVADLRFKVKKNKKRDSIYSVHDNVVGPVEVAYDRRGLRERDEDNTQDIQTKLWFSTYIKFNKEKGDPDKINLRCRVHGKTVAKADARTSGGWTEGDGIHGVSRIVFYMTQFQTNNYRELLAAGEKLDPSTFPFGENPNTYKCKIRLDGKVVRTFDFKVEKDGFIKQDACSKALGSDVAHTFIPSNKSKEDVKFTSALSRKHFRHVAKTPASCRKLF